MWRAVKQQRQGLNAVSQVVGPIGGQVGQVGQLGKWAASAYNMMILAILV